MEEQRRMLEADSGRGSYVWSDEDFHNALLWFQQHEYEYEYGYECHQEDKNGETSTFSDGGGGDGLRLRALNLVDSLLQSPGIIMDRPMMMMKTKTKKSSRTTCTRTRSGRSRKRHRNEMASESRPLLPSVISQVLSMKKYSDVGNCRGSGNRNHNHDSTRTSNGDSDSDDQILNHLKSTLRIVASKRHKTEHAYNERLDQWMEQQKSLSAFGFVSGNNEAKEPLCISLDVYLKHPKTVVKMTYAEQLYEKYLALKRSEDKMEADRQQGSSNINSDRVTRSEMEMNKRESSKILLEKLCALASLQPDVAETLLLMTLVPIKQHQCQCKGHHDWTVDIMNHIQPDPQQRLLRTTEQEEWKVEREAWDHLVELIPQKMNDVSPHSSSPSANSNSHSNFNSNHHNRTRFTTRMYMNTLAKLHPSLLTNVSKLYFPIAKHIIQSLAKCAVECHGRIPDYVAAKAALNFHPCRHGDVDGHYNSRMCVIADGENTSGAHENVMTTKMGAIMMTTTTKEEEEDPKVCYDDCVDRLVHMKQANEGLESLCRHILVELGGNCYGNGNCDGNQAASTLTSTSASTLTSGTDEQRSRAYNDLVQHIFSHK